MASAAGDNNGFEVEEARGDRDTVDSEQAVNPAAQRSLPLENSAAPLPVPPAPLGKYDMSENDLSLHRQKAAEKVEGFRRMKRLRWHISRKKEFVEFVSGLSDDLLFEVMAMPPKTKKHRFRGAPAAGESTAPARESLERTEEVQDPSSGSAGQ